MNRRQWLKGCVGVAAIAGMGSALAADDAVPYSRETYEQALASGDAFMLDFYASW